MQLPLSQRLLISKELSAANDKSSVSALMKTYNCFMPFTSNGFSELPTEMGPLMESPNLWRRSKWDKIVCKLYCDFLQYTPCVTSNLTQAYSKLIQTFTTSLLYPAVSIGSCTEMLSVQNEWMNECCCQLWNIFQKTDLWKSSKGEIHPRII